MVHIITGPINSGKTTKMIETYKLLNGQKDTENIEVDYSRLDMSSDGFISEKIMIGSRVQGYKAVQLSSGNKMDLIIREENQPENFISLSQIGPYYISKKTVNWIDICVKDMLGFNMKSIFLDEIGPVELEESGFHTILLRLLKSRANVYITVRDTLLADVINKYEIKVYNLIRIGED